MSHDAVDHERLLSITAVKPKLTSEPWITELLDAQSHQIRSERYAEIRLLRPHWREHGAPNTRVNDQIYRTHSHVISICSNNEALDIRSLFHPEADVLSLGRFSYLNVLTDSKHKVLIWQHWASVWSFYAQVLVGWYLLNYVYRLLSLDGHWQTIRFIRFVSIGVDCLVIIFATCHISFHEMTRLCWVSVLKPLFTGVNSKGFCSWGRFTACKV